VISLSPAASSARRDRRFARQGRHRRRPTGSDVDEPYKIRPHPAHGPHWACGHGPPDS